jgi:hypothetical protein
MQIMVTQFFDADGVSYHDRFQVWRTTHQDGIVLSLEARNRGKLHGARCQHFGSGPPYFLLEDGFGSLTIKRKICGSEAELLTWATENGIGVTHCRHCLRAKLIGGHGAAVLPTLVANKPPGNEQPQDTHSGNRLPEEVSGESGYTEGSVEHILVNRYERDPRARQACIGHYGTTCVLCEFNFAATYGELMADFIHVHHLKPLASVGSDYEVDPVQDLRPVCPNCHAVLHRRDPPYELDEVRQFLQNN